MQWQYCFQLFGFVGDYGACALFANHFGLDGRLVVAAPIQYLGMRRAYRGATFIETISPVLNGCGLVANECGSVDSLCVVYDRQTQ